MLPTILILLTSLTALAVCLPLQAAGILKERAPSGPVIAPNFPDPGLIKVNNVWYAFATRTKGTTIHVQIAKSNDFNSWQIVNNADGSQKDALPQLPGWVNQTNWNTWGPSIAQLGPNNFIMYFSATTNADTSARFHCIGYATASNIEGPYTGPATASVCPLQQGGAIDPQAFQDTNGQRYFVYKVDGNSIGNGGLCGDTVQPIKSTPLMLQKVAADGHTLQGAPTQLIDNAGISDDGIVEAPSITRTSGGKYFLFFSKGCFLDNTYTVSYATASSVTGPWTRQSRPLFQSGDFGLTGPGSADVAPDAKHMVFHSFNGDPARFIRSMHTALLTISGDTVTA
ncbi:putative glycosyl hydrolases family 43 protein [Elsinoe australis]|uniref:Putative glycosyl hydrolases family 43 protein n=1 Tax=Elsinoe australis TaxID=40998 RepID=A0A4U7B3Q6_9PEZI|nr:putative glycosyl hydrolases family 43 protein [Elsinoe australis]